MVVIQLSIKANEQEEAVPLLPCFAGRDIPPSSNLIMGCGFWAGEQVRSAFCIWFCS